MPSESRPPVHLECLVAALLITSVAGQRIHSEGAAASKPDTGSVFFSPPFFAAAPQRSARGQSSPSASSNMRATISERRYETGAL